jgi:hypothetical protein
MKLNSFIRSARLEEKPIMLFVSLHFIAWIFTILRLALGVILIFRRLE